MLSTIKKYWNLFLLLIFILGVFWIYFNKTTANYTMKGEISAPHQGFLAPNFTLQALDGSTYSLTDLRGKAVLVNFWTSWCPPCRSEMPDMQKVFLDYQDEDFIILAVNSTIQDSKENAIEFAQEYSLTFPILFDDQGDTTQAYQVSSLPTSFFIDQEGIIREVVVGGPMAEALLMDRIERLLDAEE
jgi:peroxiredoxin